MTNVEVYDAAGRLQILDRPLDMILIEFNILQPGDEVERYYNGRYVYTESRYPSPPSHENTLLAFQPNKQLKYADQRHAGGKVTNYVDESQLYFTVQNNPMSIYYYTWLRPPNMRKENLGIEVFNDAGEVTWASYEKSMNILDVIRIKDLRTLGVGADDLYRVNFGHQDVAVIPVKIPFYLQNDTEYSATWSFDENGALRIYRYLHYKLEQDELDQSRYQYSYYSLEFIVVDVRNVQQSENQRVLPRYAN